VSRTVYRRDARSNGVRGPGIPAPGGLSPMPDGANENTLLFRQGLGSATWGG
jgi:hypothetical protein